MWLKDISIVCDGGHYFQWSIIVLFGRIQHEHFID